MWVLSIFSSCSRPYRCIYVMRLCFGNLKWVLRLLGEWIYRFSTWEFQKFPGSATKSQRFGSWSLHFLRKYGSFLGSSTEVLDFGSHSGYCPKWAFSILRFGSRTWFYPFIFSFDFKVPKSNFRVPKGLE